jgi:hypothetical protein
MSLQTWSETLISAQIDGTALNTSTTATSILPPAAKFTLPANFFSIGKVLRVTATGRISTTTGPPTITLDVRFGSVVVFNGAAVTTVASVTNKTWMLKTLLTCRAIGASTTANVIGVGEFVSSAVVGSTGGNANTAVLPDSAPAVGTGFDSTSSQTVDLFATWSASSASNSIQLHEFTLEALN